MDNTINTDSNLLTKAAHSISDVFSPILMPTFAMAAALWLTMMRFLPLSIRLWALLGVFAITAAIPFTFIFIMIKKGRISDASIPERSQRFAPYLLSLICYIGAAVYLYVLRAPLWLPAFFVGAALVSAISMTITKFWKISAHVGATAGVAGAIYWLAYHGMIIEPMAWLSFIFIIVSLVAWSRLYLSRHTPLQVLAGAILAFGVEYLTLSLV